MLSLLQLQLLKNAVYYAIYIHKQIMFKALKRLYKHIELASFKIKIYDMILINDNPNFVLAMLESACIYNIGTSDCDPCFCRRCFDHELNKRT